MKALFVTSHGPLAAASRTRVFQYLPYLADAGIEPTVMQVVPDGLLRLSYARGASYRPIYHLRALWRTLRVGLVCLVMARRFDVVFLQRVMFPPPLAGWLRRNSRRTVFDFDDAIYTTDSAARGPLSRLQGWLREKAVVATLSGAHHAIVENEQNRSYAARYCPGASILTGPIDTDRYRPRERKAGPSVVLGWVGKQSTEIYLAQIRNGLAEIARRHPGTRLLLIGAERFDVDGLKVERRPWSLETELADLWEIDIGLMPLPDDEWTRGKGGYKLLQYMSLGIPAVASPVGVNAQIVDDGKTGFLASSEADWVEKLDRLIQDAGLRRRMGSAGRERVVRRYSLKRSSLELARILSEVAAASGRGTG